MALSLSLTQSITDYISLTFTDTSGDYDVSSNPTGWGSPNIAISDVDYAHILITTSLGTTYDIDLVADLGIDFSTATSSDLIYNIPYTLFGGGADTLVPDDIYEIEYRISTDSTWVDDAATNYTLTVNVMTYYVVQSDVYDKVKLLPNYYTCSKCDNKYLNEVMLLWGMLQALIASTQYSNTTRYSEILSALEDILSFNTDNCTSCGC